MIEIEIGSTNVYQDLGLPNADEMLIKAQLVTKISDIINQRGLTQKQAAKLLGTTQPRLSSLLLGRFNSISESKLLEYMTKLGQRVEIVVTLQDQLEPEVSPVLKFA